MNNLAVLRGNLTIQSDKKIAIVASRFNSFVVDALQKGAISTLKHYGLPLENITIVEVPGACELPLAIKKIAKSNKYAGIIALGAIIKGETAHFDFVAAAANNGFSQLSLEYEIPITFGVLTTNNLEQAIDRAGGKAGNKGSECATAVVEMISLLSKLEG